eukprot:m.254383 g.254383  ORF g.254383 m.254383 type:complete len:156 (-) comp26539_c1_seq11:132-599(-)
MLTDRVDFNVSGVKGRPVRKAGPRRRSDERRGGLTGASLVTVDVVLEVDGIVVVVVVDRRSDDGDESAGDASPEERPRDTPLALGNTGVDIVFGLRVVGKEIRMGYRPEIGATDARVGAVGGWGEWCHRGVVVDSGGGRVAGECATMGTARRRTV